MNYDGIFHDGPVETYRLIRTELADKARNAAMRGKPTMWAYYTDMYEALAEEFADVHLSDGGYAGAALAISQIAESQCPNLPPKDAARKWAISVYARRILRAWNAGCPPVSLDWLRERAEVTV